MSGDDSQWSTGLDDSGTIEPGAGTCRAAQKGGILAGDIKGLHGSWSLLAAHKTQTDKCQLASTLDLSGSDTAAGSRA